ncbi:MAG: hypothetical protein IH623_24540 [Verrucomicrobia bacterium]|nr:hypothetical protein [Verrucomicrobiota bacterium]
MNRANGDEPSIQMFTKYIIVVDDDVNVHMQQKLVLRHARPAPVFSGLNVRSCRPASRGTSTRRRHACCPA